MYILSLAGPRKLEALYIELEGNYHGHIAACLDSFPSKWGRLDHDQQITVP